MYTLKFLMTVWKLTVTILSYDSISLIVFLLWTQLLLIQPQHLAANHSFEGRLQGVSWHLRVQGPEEGELKVLMGRLLGVIWGEGISVNTLLVYSQENILTTHVHHYYIQNQRTENENSGLQGQKKGNVHRAFDHWCLAVFSFWYTWLYKGVTFVFFLSFPLFLPFDWTLRYWVCVCCFVLFCMLCYVMLCMKKFKINAKTRTIKLKH